MPDESTGSPAGGPPAFPGNPPGPVPPEQGPPGPVPPEPGQGPGAPSMPPPMPPPAPPSYPTAPSGGYPPPTRGQYAAPAYDLPTGVPYASWGTRLGGWLIDFVIFIVVQGVVNGIVRGSNALALHFTTKTNNGSVVHHNRISFLAVIITVAVAVAYATILCGSRRGQTVGMMAVGVRVVRDGSLGVLGYGPALVRAVIEQVFRYTVIVWVIDMLFPLWDGKRQTLHDKVVASVVIRVRNTG
jgi:uncharacterized RDD family membrane protein YckC